MIRVQQLTKKYGGRPAVDEVSFHVPKGEITGFLGPNGAGKTTTLRMLTGYLAPDQGSVHIDGVDAVKDPVEARKRIGYLPESVPLYRELRVEEYLRYRARLKGVARRQLKERVQTAMEMAKVTDVHRRIIGQLSRGYRSRVGLADALVSDPPLLVLDEPTAGLDPNQIRQVRNLIRAMAGQKTVLLSTHILPEVESTCRRVLIIHQGKLVGEGVPGDLRAKGRSVQLLTVEGRGEEQRFTSLLEGVDGVRRLASVSKAGAAADAGDDAQNTILRVHLEADLDPEVPERVFAAVAQAGLTLRELRREQASLEEVFASLTMEESAEGAGGEQVNGEKAGDKAGDDGDDKAGEDGDDKAGDKAEPDGRAGDAQ